MYRAGGHFTNQASHHLICQRHAEFDRSEWSEQSHSVTKERKLKWEQIP